MAGRTATPRTQPVPVRVGGFGGADGLAAYLRASGTGALIDATHPYAANISRNAVVAAAAAGVPLLALRRPPWQRLAGDRWHEVGTVCDAVGALGTRPRRVFLALGRREISAFEAAPQHFYLVRSVDLVEPPLGVPAARYLLDRGPFDNAGERRLLAEHAIETIVARNSGGAAAYGKIAAARAAGIEVIMLRRPDLPDAPAVASVDDAAGWLGHVLARRAV